MALRTVSETIGNHAGGLTFTARDGQTHRVRPLDLALMGRFEKWLESRALKAVIDHRETFGGAFQEAVSAVSSDIIAGRYAFGGPDCQRALQSAQGMIALVGLMLGVDDIRARYLVTNEAEELKVVVDQMIQESMPRSEGNGPAPTEGKT
jgi:hypothetical protein